MIIATVVLLALIPTLLVGCVVNYHARTTIQEEKLDSLSGMVHMMDVHLSRYYDRLIFDVRSKAENGILKTVLAAEGQTGLNSGEREAADKLLMEYIGFQVIGGAVISPDGKVILSSRAEEEGLMLNRTALYNNIMNGIASYIGMITINDDMEFIEIAVPIHDDQGRIIGILKQNAGLDLLNDYLNSLNLGNSGYAFLIRKNGYMIYDKDSGKPAILYHEYQSNNSLEQLVTDFKIGRLKQDRGVIEFKNKGIEYVGAYDKVDSVGCIAVVAMNKDEMYGDIFKLRGILSAVVLFLILIIATSGYIIGCLHSKPIKMMNATLRKIANGDLTARCTYKGVKEFEELCRNINNLADSSQKSEKELRMSSRVDTITHLPNRNAIYELLDTLLYKHPNQAVLLLDLDGFKNINDNLGYDIGDRILMEVSDILRALPQHVCYPSRLGGAEFLIFITNWTAPKYPERIAEKIIKDIEGIRFIDEIHVDIGASIGIEYTDEERIDKKKLIKHSNIAMHKARLIGRNSYFVHYPYMQKEI